MGRHTVMLVDNLGKNAEGLEFGDRVQFRNGLLGQLSVILLRCAHVMKVARADRALDGY